MSPNREAYDYMQQSKENRWNVGGYHVAGGESIIQNHFSGPITVIAAHADGINITSAAHGLVPGDVIDIYGCGTAAYNDRWTVITVVGVNNFTVRATFVVTSLGGWRRREGAASPIFTEYTPAPDALYVAAGWPASYDLFRAPNPITAIAAHADGINITSAAHALIVGDMVNIVGTLTSDYDGMWQVITVVGANNFTVGATFTATATGDWELRYGCPVKGEQEIEVNFFNTAGVGTADLEVWYAQPVAQLWTRDANIIAVDVNHRTFRLDVGALAAGHGSVDRIAIVGINQLGGITYLCTCHRVSKVPGGSTGSRG